MEKKRVHLVCNSHLDPVWLWEWEEGAAVALSTFRQAVQFCEEIDGFVFNHNEVVLYEWILEYDVDLFKRIQKLVKAGKWHIMGGWYVQPDCNLPAGESFVRQILTGYRFFKKHFGVYPQTAINFDPFGHSRGLVQILKGCGFHSYIVCRPKAVDLPLPRDEVCWLGYDGSSVLLHRVNHHYDSRPGMAREKIEEIIEYAKGKEVILVLWGVGNHGGAPSRKDFKDIDELRENLQEEAEIIHSTPEQYFQDLANREKELPLWDRALNPWAVGCYTSQVRIKQLHRRLEADLFLTEKMASAAHYNGLMDYPKAELDKSLRSLLLSQFHDILPGSSTQPVEEHALRLLSHGLEECHRVRARAFFALSKDQGKAKDGTFPILIYNPHPFEVKTFVEAEFMFEDHNWDGGFHLVGAHQGNKKLTAQVEKEESNFPVEWRKRIVFEATLLPSSMNRVDCTLRRVDEKPKVEVRDERHLLHFHSDFLDVVVNTRTGLIDSYRVNGVDMVDDKAFQPIVMEDTEDSWGMTTKHFGTVIGRFRRMNKEQAKSFANVDCKNFEAVRIIEDGPLRSVVEALFVWNGSHICQRYKIPKEGTELEVATRVFWNEKSAMLKLSVPILEAPGSRYLGQTAFGREELPVNGDECVAQRWVAVVNDKNNKCVSCVNEGSYGSDFSWRGLRLTLLRSPGYAAHPVPGYDHFMPQDRFEPYVDQGERCFRFWFNVGPINERLALLPREADIHNEPPFALSHFPGGKVEKVKPFFKLSDDVVQMSSIKRAEAGRGYIVRLFEPTGKKRKTTLSLPGTKFSQKVELRPFEVKTLRVMPAKNSCWEVSLLEQKI